MQRNQHMHVAVKLQQMLEADDQLRESSRTTSTGPAGAFVECEKHDHRTG